MVDELKALKEGLETQRPAQWEDLPDIALYMDQVVGYMSRQLMECGEGDRLTSAMVNNYIKDGLLPRAEGKRYNRVHLAYLTAICAMKQVLPVRDAGLLAEAETGDERAMYERFRAQLDTALSETALRLDDTVQLDEDGLNELALSLALRSYANKLACLRVIEQIRRGRPAPEKSKKDRKEKKHE